MKLYLFGGAEVDQNQVPQLISFFQQVLRQLQPKQLLHVPFARTQVPPGEEAVWGEGWIKQLRQDGMELLDARQSEDLERADQPVVFISGGSQHQELYTQLTENQRLRELVLGAEYVIGESAGAKVFGQYQRYTSPTGKSYVGPGLGVLAETIIEPHYTQRGRHELLREEMIASGAKYGIGIDSVSAIVVEPASFPDQYETIGTGLVEVVKR